jgi:hypothetical protein
MRRAIGLAATAAMLAACGGEPRLMNVRSADRTPDEFAIVPSRPLAEPPSFTALPTPVPGAPNRADRRPGAELIATLGGNAAAGVSGDGALVSTVARYGVAQDIRGVLAREDLAFRRANDGRLLERLFDVNVYYRAYARQALDQHGELARLRALGIRTVAAPPDPAR